jgi:uncharacterized protein YcnI
MKKVRQHKIIIMLAVVIGICTASVYEQAYAHVVVQPKQVTPGEYQTFTVSVPNEKDIPVVAIRLAIPDDVEVVVPTVKQGWSISMKKVGKNITEVNWTDGVIDVGMRDEFTFTAQVPGTEGEVIWKAYQTYRDGSVAAWDQAPGNSQSHAGKDGSKGPYSMTTVGEDKVVKSVFSPLDAGVYVLSGIAMIVSLIALSRTIKT